ncbi:MAG: DUF3299 domain-containing protein [Pontibacterium sp.]
MFEGNLLRLFLVLWLSCIGLFANLAHANLVNGEEVRQLEWEELMPEDYSLDALFDSQMSSLETLNDYDTEAMALMDEMMLVLSSAPIVPEMDQKMVRLPGFVVPVLGDDRVITSFFLVPYFGACIHAPPPPSNQIVYVEFEPGIKIENLYDAVWVTGKLSTETTTNELASSGYKMEAFIIEPYEE